MQWLIEAALFQWRYGFQSRLRIGLYRGIGMRIGPKCRMESIRVRRPTQIVLGAYNSLTEGCWLWPFDSESATPRICIGDHNYFNRDVMIDACGRVQIGSHNMFGPGVYITDSNHVMDPSQWVGESPMIVGRVVIGNGCWFGARATILKDVELGDRCVVAAGAVVTKSFPSGSVIAGVPGVLLRRL